MKSLSLSRPLMLMTVGLPGAGKTRFSVQFAEMFSAPLVSYDRIRYELFNEPTYSDDEAAIIQRIADYQVEELLKTKKTLIIDGAANTRADRTVLRQMAAKNGYGTLLVWIQTDPSTCESRSVSSRLQHEDKWRSAISRPIFTQLSRRFQAPGMNESYVVISGKHTFGAQARTVLKRLVPSEEQQIKSTAGSQGTTAAPRTQRPNQPPSSPNRRSVTIN